MTSLPWSRPLTQRDTYEQIAHVRADEAYEATAPYPVTIIPARLLGDG